jgi:two-component system KDP operon response regulator KdpE
MNRRARVLVCDDDPRSIRALRVVLRDAGFDVEVARTLREAVTCAALRPPAAVLAEWVLPDGDGGELCRRLRAWSTVPLLVVSAVDCEGEKVRALEAGADGYITKPFGPRELVARLRALLRRAEPFPAVQRVGFDGVEIDLAAQLVRRDDVEVHLTPIEGRLLHALLRHRGRPLTHRALLHEVWGPARGQGTESLRTHIANLRRKIEPAHGPQRILTVHGVGYRLVDAPPERTPLAVAPSLRLAA